MEKNYNHNACEDALYQSWEDSGLMKADNQSTKEPFTVVLPPPNVTGILHMGHACMLAVQDILVRYKKMTGFEVLWLPGTDHAAIATENVVLKHLGMKKREEMSREDFLEECRKFSQDKHDRIINQTKKMGSWLDWSREAYTLDDERSHAVRTIFKKLWKDGLIVRGYRMVNWSVGAQSVLADDEVEHKEVNGFFYHYKYEIVDGDGAYLEVATTRPETLFGDTAVAIHPDDARAADLKGKKVRIPFTGREIPIILDDYVALDKGTATMKVTPAHDPNDFEIGQRHDLEQLQVIDFDGTMMKVPEVPEDHQGLTREESRKKLAQESEFLLVKKPHVHSIGHCYRSDTVVEPMLSKQWFIAVNNEFFLEGVGKTTLKKLTLEAVKDAHIDVMPKRFEKTYYQWIENLRDWCISRQIWWGHRIPVWYGDVDGEEVLSVDGPEELEAKGATNIRQEEDTLDTWFSSALWPFSTLGWPNTDAQDFQKFYPNQLMETGHDILFFWVARMIMFGKYATGKYPFSHLYLHGLVVDEKGRKMSKSRGNGIDPLVMIDELGADAVRLSLVIGTTPGNPIPIGQEKIRGYRNFVNKLWNAGRFVRFQMTDDSKQLTEKDVVAQSLADKWIASRFTAVVQSVRNHLENYEISQAGDMMYHFVWGEFCDWYIEASKVEPNPAFLRHLFAEILALVHPLCPFITEKLWQDVLDQRSSLVERDFPTGFTRDEPLEAEFEALQNIVTEIRRLRGEKKLNPKEKLAVKIQKTQTELPIDLLKVLALLSEVDLVDSVANPQIVVNGRSIWVDIPVDEKALAAEKAQLEKTIAALQGRLANKNYTDKAPEHLVADTRKQLEDTQEKLRILSGE